MACTKIRRVSSAPPYLLNISFIRNKDAYCCPLTNRFSVNFPQHSWFLESFPTRSRHELYRIVSSIHHELLVRAFTRYLWLHDITTKEPKAKQGGPLQREVPNDPETPPKTSLIPLGHHTPSLLRRKEQ